MKISQLAAAASLAATELLVLSKPSATVTITRTDISALASDNSYNTVAGSFVTAGFVVGMNVRVIGFTGNVVNNIFSATVTAVTALKLTIGGADGNVIVDDAAGESVTITAWTSVYTTLAAVLGPNVQSVASSATVTPTFLNDMVKVTAQAAALALANPTGTPVEGKRILIRIKDNGTARAISYGGQYRAVGVTLPTTTVINKTHYLTCIWNDTDTRLDVIAVVQEA